eukprot:194838_1
MAAADDTLSPEHEMSHAYKTIRLRFQNGVQSLDCTLEILRLRIEAETQFTDNLKKIIESSNRLLPHLNQNESLRQYGFESLHTDFKNEYKQRMAFLNSLKHDVEPPIASMKSTYHTQYKFFSSQSKQDLKSLKQQQHEFTKLKEKYDKLTRGDKHKNKRQLLLNVERKFKQQQSVWAKQQKTFDNKMETALHSMECNEGKRLETLMSGVTNWSAFITNLCANRKYDIESLTESMAAINVDEDLRTFMRRTRFSIYGL